MFRKSTFWGLLIVAMVLIWVPRLWAQGQPTDPNVPGFRFGEAVQAAGIIVVLINLLKDQFNLQGDKIKYVVMAISAGYAIVSYEVWLDFGAKIGFVAIAFAFTYGMAVGGWKSAKILAHKAGTAPTSTTTNDTTK